MRAIYFISFITAFFLVSCQTSKQCCKAKPSEFSDYENLYLKDGLSYYTLFQSGDEILSPDGEKTKSKENLDCIALIKTDKRKELKLFVGFETKIYNPKLGAGGGGFMATIEYKKGEYKLKETPQGIDYKPVGQTINNCGGKLGLDGFVYSAEEFYSNSKQELFQILQDSSDFKQKPITENFGWMVKINPKTAEAVAKVKQFGRYCHEDALFTPDGKNVFLTNDEAPAVLFKFVAETAFNYEKGQLYAFSESKKWISLPMDDQSLANIRQIAFTKGATLFTRHEWLTLVGDKLYITETGKDSTDYQPFIDLGGKLPSYYPNGFIDDPYGRILCLDIKTNELKVELEGGKYGENFFSNPDCITSYTKNGKSFLIINEDIIGISRNRSNFDFYQNEVYKYDLQTKKLELIAIAPKGSETTGGIFDEFGNYFVNIQHPDFNNKTKFNRSTLLVIKGIQD
jgi:uncharacterized protein